MYPDTLESELGELEQAETEEESLGYAAEPELESAEASYEALESDHFLGDIIQKALPIISRAASSGSNKVFLQNLANQAARAAGGAIAGPQGAKIASQVASKCLQEVEAETEFEEEVVPEREPENVDHQVLDEAQYYAAMAAEAETEEEQDRFLGALVPLIGQLAGPILSGLTGGDGDGERDPFLGDILGGLLGEEEGAYQGERDPFDGERDPVDREKDPFLGDILGGFLGEEEGAYQGERDPFLPALIPLAAPLIGKGIGAIAKLLGKNKRTKGGIRALPGIGARAASAVASQARRGRKITPTNVAAAVSQQAARTIASPPRLRDDMRRNRVHAGHGQRRPSRPPRPRPPYATRPRRRSLVGYIPVYAPSRSYTI
jgi:hypothetical protein